MSICQYCNAILPMQWQIIYGKSVFFFFFFFFFEDGGGLRGGGLPKKKLWLFSEDGSISERMVKRVSRVHTTL